MAARISTLTLPSEHQEQVGFVQWFEGNFPLVRIFAIPNGEHRSMSVAKRLRAEGVRAGVPDMYVPEWGLWIEMKRQKGGRLSKDQIDWIEYLERAGQAVIVAYGASDASKKVLSFLDGKVVN